jgi:hypothetical protein
MRELLGATGNVFSSENHAFFKPYQSAKDFTYRVASVVTAPIVFAGYSLYEFSMACYMLLKAIANILILNFSVAGSDFVESGKCILGFSLMLLSALLSPLANLIDVLGSVITSLKQTMTLPKEPENFCETYEAGFEAVLDQDEQINSDDWSTFQFQSIRKL